MSKPILYIITNNHFDLTWRRCWERRFTFNGDTFVSYADLEEYYLLDNLDLARQHPEYKFEVESSMVLRKFLQRHPEALAELQELASQGRFAVTGSGEAIIDSNMVLGESLVRNYLNGLLWVEHTFDRMTRLAVRNDAFGNSAQLPQILRGVEISWCTGFSYSPAQGLYWRGLDGSTIMHRTLPVAAYGGGVVKYPPCPTCRGVGCAACHGRGIDDTLRSNLPGPLDPAALEAFNAGLVSLTPEEYLPNPEILSWAQAQPGYDVRFALEEDVLSHLQPWLQAVDNPSESELHPSVELNPNNSGVLVTRIRTKQNVRRQEYALLAVEALAVFASLKGQPYPHDALHAIWQDLFFTMFHDAITATHVDPAYAEIQDFWRKIDSSVSELRTSLLSLVVQPGSAGLTVLNLTGAPSSQLTTLNLPAGMQPITPEGELLPVLAIEPVEHGQAAVTFLAQDVPAFSGRPYRLAPSPAFMLTSLPSPTIENQRFRITAGGAGLYAVYDKALGQNILQMADTHPAELLLEHDEGSPWATLHPDQARIPLAQYTRLIRAEKGLGFQRLVFEVELPWAVGFASRGGVKGLILATLVDGLDRVDFHMNVHWATFNHRLRVAFPVPFQGSHLYGIPYGMLERQPYQPWFAWAGANGDYPAVKWAGVQGSRFSVALFNKGTPSYRMESGSSGGELILLSLLRSPAVPTYLHEPEFYSMTAYDGMRDEGEHAFDFAVTAYDGLLSESSVVLDAEGYNAGLLAVQGAVQLPSLPVVDSHNIRLAAIKWAEDTPAKPGNALILRLVEFRGQLGSVVVSLPDGVMSAAKVNLLERAEQALPITGGQVKMELRAWEIATLRLEMA